MMNKFQCAILFVVLVFIFGCDSNPASFEDTIPLRSLTTHVTPEEGGTVHPSGGEFSSGDEIEIEARPSEGYVFERWEGDLSSKSNPDMLLLDANRTITAHFLKRDYNLNIEISGEGTVRETAEESDSLDTITSVKLMALAEEGWFFDRWEGELQGSDNPEIISVGEEKNITAIFDREVTDGYTITINIEGEGSVEKDPDRNYFVDGDEVILTAVADSEWNFIEWKGDLTGTQNSQTVVIEGDIVATAVFGPYDDPFLEISQQPSTTTAGNPISPAPRLKLTDELGNPINGAEVDVSLNKRSFSSGSSTTETTNEEGIVVFDNLRIETAESGYILTFDTDETDVADISSTPFEIIAAEADPETSSVEISSESSVGQQTDIHIFLQDAFGNEVRGAANELSIRVRGSNSVTPTVSDEGGGEYKASYSPTHAGTDQVTIELNGAELSGSPFSIEISAGAPSEMNITQQPTTVTAGSPISSAPSVRVIDTFGNTLENIDVSVELDGASFPSGSTTTTATNSSGIASFDNLVIHSAGTDYTLTFHANGLSKTSNTFDVHAADADPSSGSVDIPDGITGEETHISITIQDSFGNAISGANSELSVSVSGANSSEPSVNETGNPGVYNASYIPVNVGTDRIEITLNGTSLDDSPFNSSVAAADANPSNSSVSANRTDLIVSEHSTVTVDLRDNNNRPIGGLSSDNFDIWTDGDASAGSVNETSSPGSYEFDISSTSVGEVIVSVSVNGITLSDTPVITFEVGDPYEMNIIIQPENTRSGYPIEGPPTVQVLDEFGHYIDGINVRVRELSGQEFSSGTRIVNTNSSGIAEFNDLVIHAPVRWFVLVFSVDGLENVESERFRVSFLSRSTDEE